MGIQRTMLLKRLKKEISSLVAVKFLSVAVNQIDSARIVKQNGV